MIYDVMNLRKNRWIQRSVECLTVVKNDVNDLSSSDGNDIDFRKYF